MFKNIKLLRKIVKDKTAKDKCPCCKKSNKELLHVGLSLYVCKDCLEQRKAKVDKMLDAEKVVRDSLPEKIANSVLGREL